MTAADRLLLEVALLIVVSVVAIFLLAVDTVLRVWKSLASFASNILLFLSEVVFLQIVVRLFYELFLLLVQVCLLVLLLILKRKVLLLILIVKLHLKLVFEALLAYLLSDVLIYVVVEGA